MGKSRNMRDEETSEGENVRLRHHCRPIELLDVNKRLSPIQFEKIEQSPFKSLLKLWDKYELCCPILLELIKRWDGDSCAFRIRGKMVSFKPLDVCVILELRVVGQALVADKDKNSITRDLFGGGETITIELIVSMLEDDMYTADGEVENFARLYMLLAFDTYYFPTLTRHGSIVVDYMSTLDDLENLDQYSWGLSVYDFCANGLNEAADKMKGHQNKVEMHLSGCAALLQVWALEHMPLASPLVEVPTLKFPRVLCWSNVRLQRSAVKTLFKQVNVVEHLKLSEEEMQIEMVKEAFDAIMESELGLVNHRLESMEELLRESNIVRRSTDHFGGVPHDCDSPHGEHSGPTLTPTGMGFTGDRVRGKSVGGGEQLSPYVTGASAEGGDTFTHGSQRNNEGPSTVRVVESAGPTTEIGLCMSE